MKLYVFSLVLMMTVGAVSNALSIDPGSVYTIAPGQIDVGGVTVKKGTYGVPIDEYSYVCKNGYTMVVNAYTRYSEKGVRTIPCPAGSPRASFIYLGSHWDTATSAGDEVIASEVRRQGKVLVHCVNGVDASQQVAYITAAKAGLMSARAAADAFKYSKRAGVPHGGKMENFVLQRGQ